ncbi:hypothetical protein [Pedobacter frigidisoli]|uniref:hypothetical protein n=1 Tax=Pedobacter frigidisoli TaxID=2530455 RepID=UPI00292F9002|nr:hypothetical protein [Pedobacter frigidisoli]
MIEPYLIHPEWVYASADGIIWLTSGLSSPTNLSQNACDKLMKIYRTVSTDLPMVIDFRNVLDVADRALESLMKGFQSEGRQIIFINYELIDSTIDKAINEHYQKPLKGERNDNGLCYKILNDNGLSGEGIQGAAKIFRKQKISGYIKSCYVSFDHPRFLQSTPVLATGIFDASKLISGQTAFYWICLEMADQLRSLIKENKIVMNNKEVRLLSVNLRSAPFASVVSLLISVPLTTIDHLGPKHRVHDLDILDGLENLKQFSYIYLGDFCIGGTEIKIAQTYAGISSSELNTAIVIGSYVDPEVFSSAFDLHSLVSLKSVHPSAKFTLS